jgi:hypothetical protein
MNVGKTLLGILVASLVATVIFSIAATVYLAFFSASKEMLPEDVLFFAPIIFVVVLFLGSWLGVLFTSLLRLTSLSDFQASTWAGFGNGLIWCLIANAFGSFESIHYYPPFCIAGFLAGLTYWAVVFRNREEVKSLSLPASIAENR